MRKTLNRRAFLRGAGTVAVGLPFLEEMAANQSGAAAEVPARLITLSFGLGIPREQVEQGFAGPLQPFEPFADKMAFFSRLDMSQAHEYGFGTTHFKTGDVLFVGEPQKEQYTAAGPSIEQIMLQQLHPGGAPTRIASASAGLWFTYRAPARYVCHWNYDGSPGPAPERRPSKVFSLLFGAAGLEPSPLDLGLSPAADARVRQSILDTVKADYEFAVGDRSYLGAESKAKLKVHLDTIRNIEKRLLPAEVGLGLAGGSECLKRPSPIDPEGLPYEQQEPLTPQPEGVFRPHSAPLDPVQYLAAFELHAELFALALRCDQFRFGSLLFTCKGGNLQFTGQHNAGALGVIDFAQETATDSIHNEIFHRARLPQVAMYQHYCMTGLASALRAFDDPLFVEANGRTVLDNTLVVIGTEYGNDHSPTDVFHAIAGGHGHFKSGFNQTPANVIDFYDTILRPYGVASGIGTRHAVFKHSPVELSEVLV